MVVGVSGTHSAVGLEQHLSFLTMVTMTPRTKPAPTMAARTVMMVVVVEKMG